MRRTITPIALTLVMLSVQSMYVEAAQGANRSGAGRVHVIIPTAGSRKAGTVTKMVVRYDKPEMLTGRVSDRIASVNPEQRRRWRNTIVRIAKQHRLDPALLHAVISAESSFIPEAVSEAGAMGMMQLMPSTAQRFGVDDPFDPEANIDGGARYLRHLLDRFADLNLALAAYNAGEAAVQSYGNIIPPYPETQRYVEKVLAYYAYFQERPGK